jgi:hypothetical protein
MKVRLIHPIAPDGREFSSLTIGREYEVIGIVADDYHLVDDLGEPIIFDSVCFNVTDLTEPEFWVAEFGDGGERYAGPAAWMAPGFFEDWHDGDLKSREAFAKQLAEWYPTTAAAIPKLPSNFNSDDYPEFYRANGYSVFPRVLRSPQIRILRDEINAVPDSAAVHRKQNVYGVRNLLDASAAVRSLASSPVIRQFVTPILGEDCFAARVVFFDKVPGANWALGWHQDNVICVEERRDVPGFVAWGEKAGVWQVQPPPDVLSRMVAVRVHLDDCNESNGPLRVLPGSHRHGWLDDEIDRWKRDIPAVTCIADAGGVVVMSPLVLHASSRAENATHRRVLHIEFACDELPGGLEWKWRIRP